MIALATRAERVREAQRLRAEGLTHREIADRFGVGRSTAATWIEDPDLSKQRARRKRYAGTCKGCGAPTDGSGGPDAAPEFCLNCAPDAYRIWTREAVIAAIRTWAVEHGKPPTSTEWICARNGYPARTSVYHRTDRGHTPFASWADAIEAAGFPRPELGKYERSDLRGAGWLARQILDELVTAGRPLRCRDLASPKERSRYTSTRYALRSLVRRGLVHKDGDYYAPATERAS